MARPTKKGIDYFSFDVDFFEDEKIEPISGEFGVKGEIIVVRLLCAIYRNGYFIQWTEQLKMSLANRCKVSHELIDLVINRLVKWNFFNEKLFESTAILTSNGIQTRFKEATRKRKINYEKLEYWLIFDEKTVSGGSNTLASEFRAEKTPQSKVNKSKVITSSNEEVKKNTQKKDLGCVSENLNEEENSNSQTSKNLEEEKEKNCEKKEKELPEGFTTELRDSQFFKNVCEFFSQKSELLQMKVIGRMISIAREKDFEEFRKQTKAYMDYKNQTGEKVHRFQNFSFEWDQDDWIDKLKKINQTKTQNGNEKSKSDDIIVGRVNVTKTESYLESRRRQREMESARTFETDI